MTDRNALDKFLETATEESFEKLKAGVLDRVRSAAFLPMFPGDLPYRGPLTFKGPDGSVVRFDDVLVTLEVDDPPLMNPESFTFKGDIGDVAGGLLPSSEFTPHPVPRDDANTIEGAWLTPGVDFDAAMDEDAPT